MSNNYNRYLCPVCFASISLIGLEEHLKKEHLQTCCLAYAHCLNPKCPSGRRLIFSSCFLTEHYILQELPSYENNERGCSLLFPKDKLCPHRLQCQKEYDFFQNESQMVFGPVNREGRSADPVYQKRIDAARVANRHAAIRSRRPESACFVREHYEGRSSDHSFNQQSSNGTAHDRGRDPSINNRSPAHNDRTPVYNDRRSPEYGGGSRSPSNGSRSQSFGRGSRNPSISSGSRGPANGSRNPAYDGRRSPSSGGHSPVYSGRSRDYIERRNDGRNAGYRTGNESSLGQPPPVDVLPMNAVITSEDPSVDPEARFFLVKPEPQETRDNTPPASTHSSMHTAPSSSAAAGSSSNAASSAHPAQQPSPVTSQTSTSKRVSAHPNKNVFVPPSTPRSSSIPRAHSPLRFPPPPPIHIPPPPPPPAFPPNMQAPYNGYNFPHPHSHLPPQQAQYPPIWNTGYDQSHAHHRHHSQQPARDWGNHGSSRDRQTRSDSYHSDRPGFASGLLNSEDRRQLNKPLPRPDLSYLNDDGPSKKRRKMSSQRVLVYGGKGALGSALVESFKSRGYWVLTVGVNEKADASVSIPKDCSTVVDQERHVLSEVAGKLSDGCKLDAILCVAGGWAGGNAANEAMASNADLMLRQSVWPSLIAARLAALHLAPNGLLQFTGAAAALSGTPGMIGYGLAKGAVHQLTASLAAEKSGLPSGATVLALLPSTLDTPMNRKWMPKADHSSWTPLPWVGDLLHSFISSPSTRPASGTLLKLETNGGESTAVPSKI